MATSLSSNDLRMIFAGQDITMHISDVSTDVKRFGGLADIYQGVCSRPYDGGQVKVAIKFLRSNDYELENTMRRHRREVKIWHAIHHPYILPLLGLYWSWRSLPAMVSSWCEHANIRSYLKTLPAESAGVGTKMKLLHQIAQGLEHLHCHTPPIVHGDLKGDNILVSSDGLPKICDFGLSKISGTTTDTMTHLRGSLRWMAPELFDDYAEVSTAGDVWSYACVIVEVYTGLRPYATKESDSAVLLALARQEIPPRPVDISDACWKLARRCFDFDPQHRLTASRIVGDIAFTSESTYILHIADPSHHVETPLPRTAVRERGLTTGIRRPIQRLVSAASVALMRPIQRRRSSNAIVADDSPWELDSPVLLDETRAISMDLPAHSTSTTLANDMKTVGQASKGHGASAPVLLSGSNMEGGPLVEINCAPDVAESRPGCKVSITIRAKALYDYTASPDDPNELSLSKKEVVEITDKQGRWWNAQKADGSTGIVPSNYMQLLPVPESAPGASQIRAKVLHDYAAWPNNSSEITIWAGEVLEVIDQLGTWWQVKKADGSKGVAPSESLQLVIDRESVNGAKAL